MACPSCTAEWLSAARQEGPADDLDETVGQFRVVAAQQGDGVGGAREVLALGVTSQGLLQVLDVEAAAEP